MLSLFYCKVLVMQLRLWFEFFDFAAYDAKRRTFAREYFR